jgi:hypothetical protein
MSDERIALRPPLWAYGDIPELVRRITPVLRAFDFRKVKSGGSPILSEALTPSFPASVITLSIALRKADYVIATLFNGTANEGIYLNGGEKLSPNSLYSFDLPLVEGQSMNFKLAHDNFIQTFTIYEAGVLT